MMPDLGEGWSNLGGRGRDGGRCASMWMVSVDVYGGVSGSSPQLFHSVSLEFLLLSGL